MTKTTGEKPRSRSRLQQFRERMQLRSLKARKKVEDISKDDVKTFLRRNAFVLFTVGAVVFGQCTWFIKITFIQSMKVCSNHLKKPSNLKLVSCSRTHIYNYFRSLITIPHHQFAVKFRSILIMDDFWYMAEKSLWQIWNVLIFFFQVLRWDLLWGRIRCHTGKWSISPFLVNYWCVCCRC